MKAGVRKLRLDNSSSSLARDILNSGCEGSLRLHRERLRNKAELKRRVMEELQMALIGPVKLALIKPQTNATWYPQSGARFSLFAFYPFLVSCEMSRRGLPVRDWRNLTVQAAQDLTLPLNLLHLPDPPSPSSRSLVVRQPHQPGQLAFFQERRKKKQYCFTTSTKPLPTP